RGRGVPSHHHAGLLAPRQPVAPLSRGRRRAGVGGAAGAVPERAGPLGAWRAVSAYLDFEKPVIELEQKIRELQTRATERGLDAGAAIAELGRRADSLRREIF